MLVTHLDKNYLLWGKLYLLSAAKYSPNEQVYISTVNLTDDEVKWLSDFHPSVLIKNHKIDVPESIRYRQYMQCRITHVLLEVFHEFRGQNSICIVTDADMLIRKTTDELYNLIEEKDVLLKFDKEHLDMGEIQNGVIVFKFASSSVLSFLEFYNQMWKDGRVVYRDDQRQLFKAYEQFKNLLVFGELPFDYVDGDFDKNSHIWSAHKGDRLPNYNVFLGELGLPKVKECPNPSWVGKSDGRKEAN